MNTPDQLDTMLTVTGSRSWLGLVAIGLLVTVFIIWAFTGTITDEVTGQGILLRPGGVSRDVSPVEGQVESIEISPGETIKEGQAVAVLNHPDYGEYTVKSSDSGRVLEVYMRLGELLKTGNILFSLEISNGGTEAPEAILFVPAEEGRQVKQGMEVKLASAGFSPEEYGYMLGRVNEVADYPSTFEGVLSVVGHEELANRMMADGLPVRIQVELLRDEQTTSGFRWTTGRGPDTVIHSGMLIRGEIIVREERPVNLFIPGLEYN